MGDRQTVLHGLNVLILLFFIILAGSLAKNVLGQSRVNTNTLRSVSSPTPTPTSVPVINTEGLKDIELQYNQQGVISSPDTVEKSTVRPKSPAIIYNETQQKTNVQTTTKNSTDIKAPDTSSYNQQGQETGFSETKSGEKGSSEAATPTPTVTYNQLQQKANNTVLVLRSTMNKIVGIFKGLFSFFGR